MAIATGRKIREAFQDAGEETAAGLLWATEADLVASDDPGSSPFVRASSKVGPWSIVGSGAAIRFATGDFGIIL